MPLTDASREAAADAVVALGNYVSLHTADPGTTGANEAAGGSPAYARQATTWSADTTDDGVRTGSEVTFDLPGGTFTHAGIWTAATGGTFIGGETLRSGGVDAPLTVSAQDQAKITPTYTQS